MNLEKEEKPYFNRHFLEEIMLEKIRELQKRNYQIFYSPPPVLAWYPIWASHPVDGSSGSSDTCHAQWLHTG